MIPAVLLATNKEPLAVLAQQITSSPGSPSATTTIDGKQIPHAPFKFGGTIERSAAQSKPYGPPRVEPPKGAPNVLPNAVRTLEKDADGLLTFFDYPAE